MDHYGKFYDIKFCGKNCVTAILVLSREMNDASPQFGGFNLDG